MHALSHATTRRQTDNVSPRYAADLSDTIVVPSRSRPGAFHFVQVNVLAGCTSGCSCEAGQRKQVCWARRQVDAVEGSWGFTRCADCRALMRLGRWHSGSGAAIAIWVCPQSEDHYRREAATAVLYRAAQGQGYAVGTRGSWRMR